MCRQPASEVGCNFEKEVKIEFRNEILYCGGRVTVLEMNRCRVRPYTVVGGGGGVGRNTVDGIIQGRRLRGDINYRL